MRLHRDIVLSSVLGMLVAHGCGTQPSVDPPVAEKPAGVDRASGDGTPIAASSRADANVARPQPDNASPPAAARAEVPNPAVIAPPAAPPKPSAEQIAKWAVAEFDPLVLLACHDGFEDPAVLSMAISPDGKQFALGGAKLTLWKVTESEPAAELLAKYKHDEVERPLRCVSISPDGKWVAAGDQKGRVRIWALNDQREAALIQAHDGRVMQLAFSPNSRLLASTSYSGDVVLWQLPDGKKLKSIEMSEHEIHRLAFLPGNLLASGGGEANIWNVENGTKVATLTKKYVSGAGLGVSKDRRLLAFNDPDGNVGIWDVAAGKLTGTTLRGAGAGLIDFSHDGKWIATYSGDSTVRIWDAATGDVVQVIDADGGETSALAWLGDANVLLVASTNGRVRMWGTPSTAGAVGLKPMQLPELAESGGDRKSLTPAQVKRVIDIRSFPRLPGAVPQWSQFGSVAYTVGASQDEAALFYRYYLGKAGWTEIARSGSGQPGLTFRKADCELDVSFAQAGDYRVGRPGDLRVGLHFPGNYDVRWLPKFNATDSNSAYEAFSSLSYRTKADLTDVEVGLLKNFHEAGWTAYTRLNSSRREDTDRRSFSMLQGASELTVSIGYPANSNEELFVQTGVNVSPKSIPIPPDAGWIEFDRSTDLQAVINTKMDMQQTAKFYDTQMAAEGWLARKAGRQFKDDRGWLPYIRGQQDVTIGLLTLPGGGTRIMVGGAARSSWQLQKPVAEDKKKDKPGIQAADFKLPSGATEVKYDVDRKNIEFAVPDTTPIKLGEQFVSQMESLKWERESVGIIENEYTFITFKKDRAEVQIRARPGEKKATAMISGDGLLWDKALPTAPVRISYETWLVRGRKQATLDLLDEFAAEMKKIPAGRRSK